MTETATQLSTGTGTVNEATWSTAAGHSAFGQVALYVDGNGNAAPAGPTQTVVSVNGGLTDRSVTTVASTSTLLVATNAARKFLAFQAPQSAPVWLSLVGGTASAGGTGCMYLAEGAYYETKSFVPTNEVTYFCETAGLMLAAWEA